MCECLWTVSEDELQQLQCDLEPTGDRLAGQASPSIGTVDDIDEFIRNSLVEGVQDFVEVVRVYLRWSGQDRDLVMKVVDMLQLID